jgi:hypothetical protein
MTKAFWRNHDAGAMAVTMRSDDLGGAGDHDIEIPPVGHRNPDPFAAS